MVDPRTLPDPRWARWSGGAGLAALGSYIALIALDARYGHGPGEAPIEGQAAHAFVIGRYHLAQPDGSEATGITTLLFHARDGQWHIVVDHTS